MRCRGGGGGGGNELQWCLKALDVWKQNKKKNEKKSTGPNRHCEGNARPEKGLATSTAMLFALLCRSLPHAHDVLVRIANSLQLIGALLGLKLGSGLVARTCNVWAYTLGLDKLRLVWA